MLLGTYNIKGGIGGRAGRHGNGWNEDNTREGTHGKDGTFKYGIISEDGQWCERKEQINSLNISNLRFEPQAESGVFEPGSTLKVTYLQLENVGLEPTPRYPPIRIELDSSN